MSRPILRSPAGRSDREALRCRVIRAFAFDVVSSDAGWLGSFRRHIGTCLTCQAELVRARTAMRELRGLGYRVTQAPTGLLDIEFGEIDGRSASWPLSKAIVASLSAGALGAVLYVGLRFRTVAPTS